ncbi:MAG TPA: tripartite tricarboxylate transporter substrate binding protein [Methylomirabilota bacterium]|nr:tripartite tricarboxylate transporter substrate binding protein [Methylomirabilota bacterium]
MRTSKARSVTVIVALAVVAALAAGPAGAQGKAPTGPVEITVGSSPGGTPDVIMRNVVKIMAEEKIVPNPVVVQNRTGGSWANAYNHVLGKKGDESTLLCIAQPVYTTPIMQGTPSVIDQIVPVAGFIQSELVFLVAPGSPYKTLKDFMEAAKKEPRRLRIAGAQTGGTDHLSTALLEKAGDVKFTYVPFDGGGAAFAAFLGGNVEGVFGTLEEGLEQIKAGKARPLAILSEKRRPEDSYKDVPTAKEQGYDVVFGQNWSVALPPGSSPELAVWWEDKFRKVVTTKTWQDGVKAKFQTSEFYGLDRVKGYLSRQQEIYRTLMAELGLAKK